MVKGNSHCNSTHRERPIYRQYTCYSPIPRSRALSGYQLQCRAVRYQLFNLQFTQFQFFRMTWSHGRLALTLRCLRGQLLLICLNLFFSFENQANQEQFQQEKGQSDSLPWNRQDRCRQGRGIPRVTYGCDDQQRGTFCVSEGHRKISLPGI